jgi:hypothetical protein
MKPTEKRIEQRDAGKTILRPQLRKVNGRMMYVIVYFNDNCSWTNWWGVSLFENQEDAFSAIENQVNDCPDKYINDRTIK